MGYIVENIDVLGPHTGFLVKHIDELLLFADESEVHSRYFPELLPFVKVLILTSIFDVASLRARLGAAVGSART